MVVVVVVVVVGSENSPFLLITIIFIVIILFQKGKQVHETDQFLSGIGQQSTGDCTVLLTATVKWTYK